MRDAGGKLADWLAFYVVDPFNFDQNTNRGWAFTVMDWINARDNISFRYYSSGSPFEHEWIRCL